MVGDGRRPPAGGLARGPQELQDARQAGDGVGRPPHSGDLTFQFCGFVFFFVFFYPLLLSLSRLDDEKQRGRKGEKTEREDEEEEKEAFLLGVG